MADPKRLLSGDPGDEASSLEMTLLRSLEPTHRERDDVLQSVMSKVTLAASAVTATSVLSSQVAATETITTAGVGAGSVSSSLAGAGASASATTTGTTFLASKVGLLALLTIPVVGVSGYALFGPDFSVSKPVTPGFVDSSTSTSAAESPALPKAEPSGPPPSTVPEAELPDTPVEQQGGKVRAMPMPVSSLVEEDRLLRQARASYKAGDFLEALRTLSVLEARFPRGELAQEREVLRITVLEESGQAKQAQDRAESFRKKFPDSPYEAPSKGSK